MVNLEILVGVGEGEVNDAVAELERDSTLRFNRCFGHLHGLCARGMVRYVRSLFRAAVQLMGVSCAGQRQLSATWGSAF